MKRIPPRPFKPGQSGNPKGRPPGSGLSAKLRKAIEKDAPDVLAALLAQAKAGDVQAARVLLDRVLPPLKATAQGVNLPGLSAGTLTNRAEAVLSAAGAGDVPPDVAAALVAAIGQTAKVAEIDGLTARIEALEKAYKAKGRDAA